MISIIGLGFVGSAILYSFEKKNIKNLYVYDKYKKLGNLEECLKSDVIFLALPTPYDDKLKEFNKKEIENICNYLNENNYNKLVIIKSTVEPETTDYLSNKYKNLNLIHNPEFLSAKTAKDDFHNQTHIVLGKSKNCDINLYNNLINFYKEHYPIAQISECSSVESESMKLFCNSYYSVKIQFFNELYLLCNKNNTNFEKIKQMMFKNKWINIMHTEVPGQDGKLSYGGACFPKDTNALNMYMKKYNVLNNVLNATIIERNILRDK